MERSEALDIIRKNWPKDIQYTEALGTLIPELKESEDERIKKELIGFIQDEIDSINRLVSGDYDYRDADDIAHQKWCKKALAWLEKQGDKAFSVERVFAEAGIKPAYKDGNSWCVLIGENIQEGICGFGETPRDAYIAFLKKLWGKAFEQNPADKVEPKFRVGDWVVNVISKEVEQIIDITDSEYICSGHLTISFDNQYLLKRWTIQDAKDGDVLSNEEMVVIFKRFEEPSYRQRIVAYIGLDTSGGIQITDETWTLGIDKAKPATKEQRDLLFQKIKDAGYEWDAEKDELRKIEQKPSIEICPHSIKSKSYLETGYQVEQKPAWSEEDEIGFRDAMWAIEQARTIAKDENDMGNLWYAEKWLKSLKERVQSQQGWSEDDEKMVEFWNLYYEHKVGDMPNKDVVENLEKFRDWLKALKERYTWKPSDEQMIPSASVCCFGDKEIESL